MPGHEEFSPAREPLIGEGRGPGEGWAWACGLWAPTEKGHGAGRRHALFDVLPVSQLGVALLP